MDRFNIIAIIILIALIGLKTLLKEINKNKALLAFAEEFLNYLHNYVDSKGNNIKAYSWLINRSNKMQTQIGKQGILSYRPPFQNYIINNYQIVLNGIPELRKAFEIRGLSSNFTLANEYANILQEAIVRHIGILEDFGKEKTRDLKNPFIWLREGIKIIVALPIISLSWFGLISKKKLRSINENILFRTISTIIGLIGLISAIMGIVLGWKPFLDILKNIL